LNANDIKAANPDVKFRAAKISGRPGLIGTRADRTEVRVIWKGEHAVWFADGVPTIEQVRIAESNLDAAQPGKEFRTVGADLYAAAVRRAGLPLAADEAGWPCAVFPGEVA
jgi:hypothetical protein